MPDDQDIREICARLLATENDEHFQAILRELKLALHRHFTDTENRGIKMLLEVPKRTAAADN